MRVLFLSPIGHIGGAERVLLDLIETIGHQEKDLDIHLITLANGPLVAAALALGAKVTVLAAPASTASLGDSATSLHGIEKLTTLLRGLFASPGAVRLAARIRSEIEQTKPDIVHSMGLKTHLLLGLARPRGPRIVWHIHEFVSARPLIAGLLKRIAPRDLTAIAISQSVADDVRRWLPHAKLSVVLNGIDTTRYSPGEPAPDWLDQRAGWKAPPDCVRVGLVATYARWKGQDIFIRAAAKLAGDPAHANLRFFVVGAPIYTTRGSQFSFEELQRLIDTLGVRDHVALTGQADDLLNIYRSLDVVVHASTKPEPFGLTIAEAMACGRAVAVSAAGGARELFTDSVDAIGIVPGQIDSLAAAIARLSRDPDLRRTLGACARATALARFDRARMARDVLSVYRTLGVGPDAV